jgi:MFS family permease
VAVALGGGALLFFTLLVVPTLIKRWGYRKCLSRGLLALAPVLLVFGGAHWLWWSEAGNEVPLPLRWAVIGVLLVFRKCGTPLAFTSVMVLVNSSVGPDQLGEVNGLGQSLAALARALGPALGGSLWSALGPTVSAVPAAARGFVVFGCCALVLAAALAVANAIPDFDGDGSSKPEGGGGDEKEVSGPAEGEQSGEAQGTQLATMAPTSKTNV